MLVPSPSRPSPAELPQPAGEAQAHSACVSEAVRAALAESGGWLDFSDYMELALYAPGLGYYAAGARKFGAAGDFVTAPELSELFGRSLARQCAEVLATLTEGDILEFGAGSGALAAGLLTELDHLGQPPRRYVILEISPELRQRQRATLQAQAPAWLDRVQWLEAMPAEPFNGIMLANEVLDALPVQRFQYDGETPQALGVGLDEQGALTWVARPADVALAAQVEAIRAGLREPWPLPYRSEWCPRLPAWVGAIADCLTQGLVLLIDYGFPRHEYYHPSQADGTLRCHYRHRVHQDPFFWPGLQDITASVDFTAVAEAAIANDLMVAGYTTQAQFLIGAGIDEVLAAGHAAASDDKAWYALSQQVQQLMLPGEMGERFQVMGLTRRYDGPLRGFITDQRHRL